MKIFIHVMDLVGPQNACIGLAQHLCQKHQVYILINEKFTEKFRRYSEKFIILGLKAAEDDEEQKQQDENNKNNVIEMVTNSFVKLGLFDPLEPSEKIQNMINTQFLKNLWKNAETFEPQIRKHIETIHPDVLVVDAKIMSPCLVYSNLPWVYIFCANPLGLFLDERLPPFSSGLPIDADRSEWDKYRKILHEDYFDKVVEKQTEICKKFGYPPIKDQIFFPRSPYLNIYQYPAELDYDDTIELPKNFQRVDAFVRDDPEQFELPKSFREKMSMKNSDDGSSKLIFLSMGSMGSCNLKLMKKLIDILGKTKHFIIVSKGLLHEHYQLNPQNMWGEKYLPQTKILPLVDLVIFHGGNNTLTETFYFGKPMIVMPLFYDQYNNAQRIDEKGYGIRLDPHRFTEEQLLSSIETILNNAELKEKMIKISERIKNSKSKEIACNRIEKVVEEFNQKQ